MSNTTNKKHPFDVLKEKGLFVPMIVAVCALILGLLIGIGVGDNDSTTAAAAKPAPTVTVTASAEPVAAVTKVPQACLDALDTADRGFTLAADLTGEFSDAIGYITSSDFSSAKESLSNIKSINSSLSNLAPDYNSDKDACRAAGANN